MATAYIVVEFNKDGQDRTLATNSRFEYGQVEHKAIFPTAAAAWEAGALCVNRKRGSHIKAMVTRVAS